MRLVPGVRQRFVRGQVDAASEEHRINKPVHSMRRNWHAAEISHISKKDPADGVCDGDELPGGDAKISSETGKRSASHERHQSSPQGCNLKSIEYLRVLSSSRCRCLVLLVLVVVKSERTGDARTWTEIRPPARQRTTHPPYLLQRVNNTSGGVA